jgi:hypothetical protein
MVTVLPHYVAFEIYPILLPSPIAGLFGFRSDTDFGQNPVRWSSFARRWLEG